MPSYQEITAPAQLPRLGAIERTTLDFKRKHVVKSDGRELAKDVAALANHLGGSILVGGDEADYVLAGWLPLTQIEAGEARNEYEQAVRDFCSPRPPIICEPIPQGSGFVLAVNVPAYPERLIGVRGARGSDCWSFPYRTASHTTFLMPEQLPMYADPRTRRALILLQTIPRGETVFVRSLHGRGSPGEHFNGVIKLIAESENAVVFVVHPSAARGTTTNTEATLPLDQIRTVFKDGKQWTLAFEALQ